MKLYFRVVFSLALLVLSFGFLCPWLFSQSSDELVITGVAVIILTPIILVYGWWDIIKNIANWFNHF